MDLLYINPKLSIPETYLTFAFSRSSGPGGQNVNKLNTRVSVSLSLTDCPCLTEFQKQKIAKTLKSRIDKEGILQVTCQEYRSQHANRNAAVQRLAGLIAEALKPAKIRRPTRTPKSAVQRRLKDKKKRSDLKKIRTERPTGE